MKKILLTSNWKMKCVSDAEYIEAKVPGSVYCDLLNAGKMEDPFWKDNEDAALALMDNDYEYQTRFDCGEDMLALDELMLVFEGLDTIADVYVNDVKIGSANNMHRIWKYSVKDILKQKDNSLCVIFHSPTKYIDEAFKKL